MNALAIGETLFLHALRHRGFSAALLAAALGIVSLSGLTAFALGRELLVIREAALGSLFLAAFLGAMLAVVLSTGRGSWPWIVETRARTGSPTDQPLALCVLAMAAASWVLLALLPFFVASLCLFHRNFACAGAALAAGGAALACAPFLDARGRVLRALPPALVGPLSLLLLSWIPGGGELASAVLLALPAVLLAAAIPGTLSFLAPGPAGWIAALGLFALSNMRQGLADHPLLGPVLRLLPDIASLNPSLRIASGNTQISWDVLGSTLYCSLFVLGLTLVSMGKATLQTE